MYIYTGIYIGVYTCIYKIEFNIDAVYSKIEQNILKNNTWLQQASCAETISNTYIVHKYYHSQHIALSSIALLDIKPGFKIVFLQLSRRLLVFNDWIVSN